MKPDGLFRDCGTPFHTSMTSAEREQLKNNLRSMIAGPGDGIDLDTPFRWVVGGLDKPEPFFRSLSLLLASDAILYFEGCSVASDVSAFYESHRALNAVAVICDTISPVPDVFHVGFSPEVVARLCELAASRPSKDLFDHVKAYQGKLLLFAFHDAFEGDLLVSERIAEPSVAKFSSSLGVSYRREPNINKRNPEQLRRVLLALENPHKIRIAGESWWSRFWRRWIWR
jgi:hypothetical protein